MLRDLRGLHKLDVPVEPPPEGRGSLLVLLGENGLGKTTFLRGVAFALVDPGVAGAFLGPAPAPYRREGAAEAVCSVETTGGTYLAVINGGGEVERITKDAAPEGPRPFVAAYGCRRGSALGTRPRPSQPTAADDIDNLFDRPNGLTDAEAWLAQLKAASHDRDDEAWRVYEAVRAAICTLLPDVADLDVMEDRRLWVTFKNEGRGRVRFAALSDGYLTTVGWAVDLMARWVERQTARLHLPVRAGFLAEMSGFVLIDEIDLHLHPVWQRRVLHDIRRLFPRLHFIVTTHNPLTITGALPGEVRVLVRDAATGEVRAEAPPFDPRLLTASQLHREFFGIPGLFPTELADKYQRYGRLAGVTARDDDEERAVWRLYEELRTAGVTVEPPEPREEPPAGGA
ncbi:MAG: AAA family ATPase [Polyangiales bacterium]